MHKIRQQLNQRNALTLVEVLITVALMSLISVVLYCSLVNGTKVWKKSQELVIEEDITIFFDKISQDLTNAYTMTDMTFTGAVHSLEFPCLVRVPADKNSAFAQDSYVSQLGQVKYSFDEASQMVLQQKANYGQMLAKEYTEARTLIKNIADLRFFYYYMENGKEVEAKRVEGIVPNAIKVEIDFQSGLSHQMIEKWINIPIGL